MPLRAEYREPTDFKDCCDEEKTSERSHAEELAMVVLVIVLLLIAFSRNKKTAQENCIPVEKYHFFPFKKRPGMPCPKPVKPCPPVNCKPVECPPVECFPPKPKCVKAEVERVICEETFNVQDIEEKVPIGIPVPYGSTLEGSVNVTVMECEPIINEVNDTISVNVTFMVQKELKITTPSGKVIPLEFAFRKLSLLTFKGCHAHNLKTGLNVEGEPLCRVLSINTEDCATLNPSIPECANNATFDENLNICVRLKVVQPVQVEVPVCKNPKQVKPCC